MRPLLATELVFAAALSGLLSLSVEAAAPPKKSTTTSSQNAKPVYKVEPEAVAALDRMAAFLKTLHSFQIKADTLTDNVLENGQTVQFAGTVDYKVRQPDRFVITVTNDRKVRQFNYDGKSFTIYSPRMGYYATVSAPPTIRKLFDRAHERYGISFPMEDLFRWGEEGENRANLKSGIVVGYAKISGQDAEHYAFLSANISWQVWIARGDKPLPLKMVLTDIADPARPQYTAIYHWNPAANFNDATFAFKSPAGGKPIKLAAR